jgi:hypothetical protein
MPALQNPYPVNASEINGITVTGTPVEGDTIVATSSTAAEWNTISITNTSSSAPIITSLGSTSGSAAQLSDVTRDYMVYLECTTAGTATTVGIGATSSANDVTIMNNAAISTGLVSFRLPAGWYFKWSGTTTAFGNQNAVGC